MFVNTTSSKLIHEPLVMVHLSVTLNPALRPVTVVLCRFTLVMDAPFAEPCTDHVPLPTPGALPESVNVGLLHCSKSAPAVAMVAVELLVSTNSSKLEQDPLVIVHRRVTLLPIVRPVTVLDSEPGVVITAPLADPMILHSPVPVTGVFAARVKFPVLHNS